MTFPQMLASLGGTLGLYGGLSFLSLFQFVELLLYMIGCCRPKYDPDDVENAPVA